MNQDYLIDTHTYASFFRILYNSTYIDRSASEEVLSMLTEASFQDGLVAGVPAGTTVAHKFGSRQTRDGKDQLHDCGIVYATGKPYILCIMTQGKDFTKLAAFIKDVSARVYTNTINP
jgi:beta-lactamase class A